MRLQQPHWLSDLRCECRREIAGGDFGVTRTEIILGALTDHSGPFSGLDIGAVHGQQLWINERNAAGGVCGRKIKLEIRDEGGKTGTRTTQYATLEPKVLGFLQIPGFSVNPALSQSMIDDETTGVALSKSRVTTAPTVCAAPSTSPSATT